MSPATSSAIAIALSTSCSRKTKARAHDEANTPTLEPSTLASTNATPRRALADLVNTSDPVWPVVSEMIAKAKNEVEILPVDPKNGEKALLTIQVTTRSPMGAIAYSSGGLLVDHGWIRVLGGGSARLPRDIGSWNFPKGVDQPPRLGDAILVADDVLGGFFAVNGGRFDGPPGHVFYLAPDTLRWEDLGRGYTDFVDFPCQGDLAKFYADLRWHGWSTDAERLAGDRAYSIYPFLWAKDGGSIDEGSRSDVPIEELWRLYAIDLHRQLADLPDGSTVKIKVVK